VSKTIHYAFCKHCWHLGPLTAVGGCFSCGRRCRAWPEYLTAYARFERECRVLAEAYPVSTTYEFRGALELGVWGEDIIEDILQLAQEVEPPETAAHLAPEEYPVLKLPKLDMVHLTVRHIYARLAVTIHEDHYSELRYHQDEGLGVPVSKAFGELRDAAVFGSQWSAGSAADPAGNTGATLRFSELSPVYEMLQARNSLWYSALEEGYYILSFQPLFGPDQSPA